MKTETIIIITKDDTGPGFNPPREECDCACPDDGYSFQVQAASGTSKLKCANVYSAPLPDGYKLYFNPLRDTGVSVLNEEAEELWSQFSNPIQYENQDALPYVARLQSIGLLEPDDSQVIVQKDNPKTLSAWLHITNQCNLRCDYCYINKSSQHMDTNVGFASIDAVIRSAILGKFKRLKIKYAGGEATLNLNLVFQLNRYAKMECSKAGLEFESVVLSNGVVLGENSIQELIAQGIRLMISLDGVGAAHDIQRKFINGKGSFAWVKRTLARLKTSGLQPFISITVTDKNLENLPETVCFILDQGLPFNINFYRDNECTSGYFDLQLRDEKLIQILKQAFRVIEANLPPYSLLGMLVDRSSFDQPHDRTCGVGQSYMVIDQHGGVSKCHMEIEKPVTNIYENDPLAFIRADSIHVQNPSVEGKKGCRDCEWRYWCTGGCPLLTYKTSGRYDVKSPYCRVYKAIYPELLRLEGLRLLKYAKASLYSSERTPV